MDKNLKLKIRKRLKRALPNMAVSLVYRVVNLRQLLRYPAFFRQYRRFKSAVEKSGRGFAVNFSDICPRLDEATKETAFDQHYVYHPAWAARILAQTKPDEHVDISSTLIFSAMISAFVKTTFYDYRPAHLGLSGLEDGQADLVKLPFEDNRIKSLSCMHTVEHVGLGRYGDKIDFNGDLAAMKELARVLAPGGNLLFVVPIGRSKIAFNAHRVYSYRQVLECFPGLELAEFSLIRDYSNGGGLVRNATEEMADDQVYGCGCFWFTKPQATTNNTGPI